MLKAERSTPRTCCTGLYWARWVQGVLPMRMGVNWNLISRFTISNAIVCSWLWSITTSCPTGYFSSITASSLYLTPQTVVVDSPLRDSWPNQTLPFFYHDYQIYILMVFLSNLNIFSFDVDSLITRWFRKCLKTSDFSKLININSRNSTNVWACFRTFLYLSGQVPLRRIHFIVPKILLFW